jgi:D-arabinose 1-dehydrogenase-like Zn-dependent alcohol dehydrogenase
VRRAEIVAWGQPLEIHDYPTPEPAGSEVLVRVTACGICHSDLHIHAGYFDLGGGRQIRIEERGVKLPFTMGHEVVGRVEKPGPEAAGVEIGREYVVYPWIGCGACDACRRGEELLCPKPRIIGTWVHGGYADHVIVPHPRYLVPFDGIPREVAATYACSGITAWSALQKTGIARPDQTLLLIGVGGVGTNALHLAPNAVPGKVIVADVDPVKREQALAAGAAAAFDPRDPAAAKQVREWTGGGCAAAIDFVGRPETAQFGLDCLQQKGGTLVVVGLYGDRLELPLPLLPLRILTIRGSYVGTLDDLKTVVRLAQEGKAPFIPVRRRPLEEVNAALADLAAGRVVGRQVLVP